MRPLGRRVPPDFEHVERYPLSALKATPTNVPVVLGIPWYESFDTPERVGDLYVIGAGDLGKVRGGHAVCAKPPKLGEPESAWKWWDQGPEGACVGFAASRMMSLLNRHRYDAHWLYRRAQEVDEWEDTPPEEGTSVRAACSILRSEGHVLDGEEKVRRGQGIKAYRWATSWDQVRSALGVPGSTPYVPILNSWGRDYPHVVHLTDEAGERVLGEEGEACLVTDR